jgi:hypothetical protein
MAKMTIDPLVKEQVFERARGRCECDISFHDHGIDKCLRKPRYIGFREDSVRVSYPQANDLMAVCPSCCSQIRHQRG